MRSLMFLGMLVLATPVFAQRQSLAERIAAIEQKQAEDPARLELVQQVNVQESVEPGIVAPVIVGTAVFAGAGVAMTVTAEEVAGVSPLEFDAVTVQRSCAPGAWLTT